jgi:hypothetical protein
MSNDQDGLAQGGGQPASGLPQQQPQQSHQPDPARPAAAPPAPTQAPTIGAGGQPIPNAVLSVRLKQAADKAAAEERRRLFAELGIDDPARFKESRERTQKELADLRAAEEKRQREAMTEQERLRKDLEAAHARIAELEAERDQLVTTTQRKEQDEQLTGIALRYINPKHAGYAVRHAFREYVLGLTPAEVTKLGQSKGEIERWFRRFARDNPELAASSQDSEKAAADAKAAEAARAQAAAAPAPAPARPRVVVQQRKITNGTPPKGAPAPAATPAAGPPSLAGDAGDRGRD